MKIKWRLEPTTTSPLKNEVDKNSISIWKKKDQLGF